MTTIIETFTHLDIITQAQRIRQVQPKLTWSQAVTYAKYIAAKKAEDLDAQFTHLQALKA